MDNSTTYELEESNIQKLSNFLIKQINAGEVLERIHPKLKTSYDNRTFHYEKNKDLEEKLIKIPKEKMNNEERMLIACLSETNLKKDLNEILEYLSNLFDLIHKVNANKKDIVEKYEDELMKIILREGLKNFFSSKIKLYIKEEYEEEEEVKVEPKQMTQEEIKRELEELQSHPLFMTEMPENAEDNVYLQSLQALKFEGKPEDVAIEFLDKAKESLGRFKKTKQFPQLREAMYYVCNAIDHVKDDSTVPDQIKFDLLLFRAEIQIMVKNLGYAVEDLKSAVFHVEDHNAYLLLIECYINLQFFDKALKLVNQRRKKLVEVEHPECYKRIQDYDNIEKIIKASKEELLQRLNQLESFKNVENKEKLKLYDILTRRGIKIRPQVHQIPPNVEAHIYMDEDLIMHFPILIIYEEFNTTDYIQDTMESTNIADILEMLLGEENTLPYDKEKKYNTNTCICFYEISEFDPILKKEVTSYYPLRNDDKLIEVLSNNLVYMNGIPVIVVVSQISNFFLHFVKNKKILRRKRD